MSNKTYWKIFPNLLNKGKGGKENCCEKRRAAQKGKERETIRLSLLGRDGPGASRTSRKGISPE